MQRTRDFLGSPVEFEIHRSAGSAQQLRSGGALGHVADFQYAEDLPQSVTSDRDAIDARIGEEAGKLRMVTRRLATQAHFPAFLVRALDDQANSFFDTWVLLVEHVGE